MTDPESDYCPDCENTGLVDYDVGGGNSKQRYCTCPIGEAAEVLEREALERHPWKRVTA
jgi:hypothetical protein